MYYFGLLGLLLKGMLEGSRINKGRARLSFYALENKPTYQAIIIDTLS